VLRLPPYQRRDQIGWSARSATSKPISKRPDPWLARFPLLESRCLVTRAAPFADLGVDEISFNTGTDDVDEIKRLADAVF
jgi:hypothetical protein